MREILAGTLLLVIGMGFGRFAFTGLYPQMVSDGIFDLHAGAWVASANYAGYLAGALLLTWRHAWRAETLCRIGLLGSLVCLLAMALAQGVGMALLLRFLAGVASAFSLVGASLWLLRPGHNARAAPLLYSGVGLGILLSAELLVLGQASGLHSGGLWLLLGVVALLTGLPIWRALARQAPLLESHSPPVESASLPAWRLVALYGLAGLGYIITATYLPLLLGGRGELQPLHIWAAFGLGAVPSCFLWHALRQRLGTSPALLLNLGVQGLGVILPALHASTVSYLFSALLVGGTFMGTVTIAMAAVRANPRLAAGMTASYGFGQILGPLLAAALQAHYQSFSPALLAAGAALGLAALLSLRPRCNGPAGYAD